jgi:hypothetical protein
MAQEPFKVLLPIFNTKQMANKKKRKISKTTGSTTGAAYTLYVAGAPAGTGVTTSTGTGSVVLSTSPTLVTPALGAASATSLTLSSALAVIYGGTGTTTSAYISKLFLTGTGTLRVNGGIGVLSYGRHSY